MTHTMNRPNAFTRRRFLSGSAMLSASALLPWTPLAEAPLAHELNPTWLLCTVSRSPSNALWELRAYAPRSNRWRLIARASDVEAVGAIAVHPARRRVYIAHDTDSFKALPRASLSIWNIYEAQGKLVAAGEEPLTLSATRPRSIAVHPRGDSLLVAATGAGLYNTLPLDPDGNIVADKHALKLTGQRSPRRTTRRAARVSTVRWAHQACARRDGKEPDSRRLLDGQGVEGECVPERPGEPREDELRIRGPLRGCASGAHDGRRSRSAWRFAGRNRLHRRSVAFRSHASVCVFSCAR